MHGYTLNELIGKNIEIFHDDEQIAHVRELNKELIKTGNGMNEEEIWHIHRDGTKFPTLMSTWLIKDDNENPVLMCATAVDITESRKAEEKFNIFREKMARTEQLASLGTLSATLAHELAQPITIARLSIENALDKLGATSSMDTITKKLKDSLAEFSDMNLIIDRLKNYARLPSKKVDRKIDLKEVAEKIADLLNNNAQRVGITLQLKGMDKLPSVYSNDKDIEQLFFSLVDNAIQSAENKRNRQLIISGAVKDEHIELQFSDNCGGIAPELLDKIFEPFVTTRPEGKGTGLGLSIVRRIVSKMSGKVWVESKAGKGSTFFVTLPINDEHNIGT
jgi:PAS domain S-box-containing protein